MSTDITFIAVGDIWESWIFYSVYILKSILFPAKQLHLSA